MLNFAGVRSDLLPWVVDKSPSKQGKYLPGSRIPILNEKILMQEKPDFVVILPWNIRDEVMAQLNYIRDWNAKFVMATPMLEVI